MPEKKYTLKVHGSFSAALCCPSLPTPCTAIHGYTYKVTAAMQTSAPYEKNGDLDLIALKHQLHALCQILDHQYLNNLDDFKEQAPSAEAIAHWFYHKLADQTAQNAILASITLEIGQEYEVSYHP
jgi:6-pyruvoyltetrahydropterin/6-carboxytetrahydropterin synthase